MNRHTDSGDAVPSRNAAHYYCLKEASLYILFNYSTTDEFGVFIVAAGAATLLHTCCNVATLQRSDGKNEASPHLFSRTFSRKPTVKKRIKGIDPNIISAKEESVTVVLDTGTTSPFGMNASMDCTIR